MPDFNEVQRKYPIKCFVCWLPNDNVIEKKKKQYRREEKRRVPFNILSSSL